MLIEYEDKVFKIPDRHKVNILVNNEERNLVLSCLGNYFSKNKTILCQIKDDDYNLLSKKEYVFLYESGSSLESNFEFKSKTLFSNTLIDFIEQNPKLFLSINDIRENMYELLTDLGVNKLKNVLSKGIEKHVEIEFHDFKVSSILEMIKINTETFTLNEKMMMYYNLLLSFSKGEQYILYLDFPIDQKVIHWIWDLPDNVMVYLDNDAIDYQTIVDWKNIQFSVIKNSTIVERLDVPDYFAAQYCYTMNSFTMKNIELQKEKNIAIFNMFKEENISFFCNFNNIKH